jgi:hypothetical protein
LLIRSVFSLKTFATLKLRTTGSVSFISPLMCIQFDMIDSKLFAKEKENKKRITILAVSCGFLVFLVIVYSGANALKCAKCMLQSC